MHSTCYAKQGCRGVTYTANATQHRGGKVLTLLVTCTTNARWPRPVWVGQQFLPVWQVGSVANATLKWWETSECGNGAGWTPKMKTCCKWLAAASQNMVAPEPWTRKQGTQFILWSKLHSEKPSWKSFGFSGTSSCWQWSFRCGKTTFSLRTWTATNAVIPCWNVCHRWLMLIAYPYWKTKIV